MRHRLDKEHNKAMTTNAAVASSVKKLVMLIMLLGLP